MQCLNISTFEYYQVTFAHHHVETMFFCHCYLTQVQVFLFLFFKLFIIFIIKSKVWNNLKATLNTNCQDVRGREEKERQDRCWHARQDMILNSKWVLIKKVKSLTMKTIKKNRANQNLGKTKTETYEAQKTQTMKRQVMALKHTDLDTNCIKQETKKALVRQGKATTHRSE